MVKKASAYLAKFNVDVALALLDKALLEGPHDRDLLIQIYQERGVALSYLERESEALEAFDLLLAISPEHLLSYTLSPQATFLFERARSTSAGKSRALIDVSWPQGLQASERLPIAVEVVADPTSMLKRMSLFMRNDEESDFRRVSIDLPSPGVPLAIVLPAAETERATVVQIYGKAYDASGNEVMLWFGPQRPRELSLGYEAPTPWYRKWWVWAAAGGVLTAGTGTAVYFLSLEEPTTVEGTIDFM